ncbi:MAG TPA: ABC transporter permease [Bacteroidales bacterium]|nr:ABC transporter permease [Bacteroidales bacterium]
MKPIKKAIRDTAEIAVEEWRHVFKDSGVMLVFFAACLIYPVLYGFIYKNEAYRNIPVVVVNESHSALSRELIRKLDATPELNIAGQVTSMASAEKLYAENEVYGIVFIPQTFAADLAAGRQTHVSGYCSMASMMYYKGFYSGFNYACLDVNRHIKMDRLQILGMTERQASTASEPILSQGHALYNPLGGFPSFLMPAVLVLIIQQTLVLGIGMLAGTAREENKHHQLVPVKRKYHRIQRVVWGKAMAYLIIYLFLGIYDLVLIPHLFQLPHFLGLGGILPFLLPYLLASIFFGMALSVFFWNREMPLLLYLCTSVPLLFISGFSWPTTHIHIFWRMVSFFFPSTFGINGFIKLNSAGASIAQIGPEIMGLWVQAGFYFVFTWFAYNWQIRQSERKSPPL